MPAAWGFGLATVAEDGTVLDTWYRELGLGVPTRIRSKKYVAAAKKGGAPESIVEPVALLIDTDAPPTSASDVYLRLHLLSHRLVKPRAVNLDDVFGLLTTVAWTNLGPVLPQHIERIQWTERRSGRLLTVHGLDKFPRMTDYVIPAGVRIADANRVRLGAHLAVGTTVMHEGFCNFNAGTLGASMVEGRISSGVLVGDGTDVGGGASIMGTLSGGGKEMITIGERCLLGANSGVGISLGDDCVVEAGLYLTAGTLVRLPDDSVVKARALSGAHGMLFRRHSQTGAVEAVTRSGTWGGLNEALHAN